MDIDFGKDLNSHLTLIFEKLEFRHELFYHLKVLYDCQLSEKAANFLNA